MSAGVLYAQVIASLAAAAPPSNRVPEAGPFFESRRSLGASTDALWPQPAWHGVAPQWRERTPVEELVRRMRRNGLPLARLWQGRGTLVSLGLSPKGKPGIWFTKQLP